ERDPELTNITQALRDAMEALPRPAIEAAQARGELAPGFDALLLLTCMVGSIEHRLVFQRRGVDDAFLERLVELLLLGALPPGKRR
ncbi:MAG TPA: TetR/AcrR family transcriptional regulator C-terminal ligand-binding domain-containing protein, partial [Candidatus Nanopelagicales bacterium]|nr:TetR/AcrR family transcriptional regulator C-terminal ligand-binding domain-containing protein [Candidatus Nanopelagicales bacterium]